MTFKYVFKIQVGDQTQVITWKRLARYAESLGLNQIIKNRFSCPFVLNVYLHDHIYDIGPTLIVDEIKRLGNGILGPGTKQAKPIDRWPLRGLWHQHFFSPHFAAKNILNRIAGNRGKIIAERVFNFDNPSPITREMIAEFSHRLTMEQLERHSNAGKLTGEWIVFAKHDGTNYYLCLATHTSDGSVMCDQIKLICL